MMTGPLIRTSQTTRPTTEPSWLSKARSIYFNIWYEICRIAKSLYNFVYLLLGAGNRVVDGFKYYLHSQSPLVEFTTSS